MREEPARINHNALRASACERRGRGGARLWLTRSTHLMQERFGPCGMLVAVGELQPFTFHLAPELARSGFARLHGVPAAFRRSFQAFSDFGRHSPIKPVGSDGSAGKKSAGNCPSFFRARPLPPHARHLAQNRAPRLRKRLLAGRLVLGVVGLTRTSQGRDGRFHRRPPVAGKFFGGSNRGRRRLAVKQRGGALWPGSSGADPRLDLGIEREPGTVDVLRARAGAAGRRRKRKRGCAQHEERADAHGLISRSVVAVIVNSIDMAFLLSVWPTGGLAVTSAYSGLSSPKREGLARSDRNALSIRRADDPAGAWCAVA